MSIDDIQDGLLAAIYTDNDQTDFDSGTYSNTEFSVDHVQLTSGQTSGIYTSRVFDSGGTGTSWDDIAWSETLPVQDKLMIFDTKADIYKSTDEGATWALVFDDYNGGEQNTGHNGLGFDLNDRLIAFRNSIIWYSDDFGESWGLLTADYGGATDIERGAINSSNTYFIAGENESVWISTNGGISWTQQNADMNGAGGTVEGFAAMGTDLYIVDADADVWKSTDSGVNWTKINDDYNGGAANEAVILRKDNNDYLYIAGALSIWRSTDSGVNWTQMTADYGGTTIYYMSAGKSTDYLYIANSNEDIYRSTDSGANWSLMASNVNGSGGNIGGMGIIDVANNLTFAARSGNTNPPTDGFSGSFSNSSGQDPSVSNAQYFQYQATFISEDDTVSSELSSVTVTYTAVEPGNNAPTITSVSDNPDPVPTGDDVTFDVDWTDGDSEGIKMFICKTNSINDATPACSGDTWCSDSNDFDLTDPIDCSYTTEVADEGTNNYYAFVCDDEIECSSSSAGTFEVSTSATPTPTPTATPTPTPEPEESPDVEVMSGGGNSPTRIIFNGEIFPGATVSLYLMGEEYGQVQIGDSVTIGSSGEFEIEAISPVEEERLYALLVKDREGNVYKSKFFNYDLEFNTIVRQRDLIFAPTIYLNKSRLMRNEILLISGYGAPGNKIEFLVGDEVMRTVDVEDTGLYRVDFNTSQVALGRHGIKTRQYDPETGKTSNNSKIKFINISLFGFSNVDFNSDSKIDIADWSIFLHSWFSTNAEEKQKADLSGNGEVGIEDFSLFLQSFQLGN